MQNCVSLESTPPVYIDGGQLSPTGATLHPNRCCFTRRGAPVEESSSVPKGCTVRRSDAAFQKQMHCFRKSFRRLLYNELMDGSSPLTGFEMLKLSNHDNSLATPNPWQLSNLDNSLATPNPLQLSNLDNSLATPNPLQLSNLDNSLATPNPLQFA
ncbi:hypothetical protein F511_24997 [Dorcoceras hygrometricum]|uniref:Uncharacterized protein n=1 Tax=Dorcoceras hygrometricum TaxID=472368 RepID=A0A2Z7D3P2_9LAMI|nr:hypothetical protein F511_24997 [Dorcoceras hygrometricum]